MQTSTLNQRNPRTLISNFFIGGLRQSTLQDIFSQKNKNMLQKSTGNEAEILFSLYENDAVDSPEGKILKSYLSQTFPELVKIHTREALVDPKFYSFLTSDISGNNQFCHVLVFYERFTLEKIKSDFDVFAEWRKLDQKFTQKNWAKNVREDIKNQKMKAGRAKNSSNTVSSRANSQDLALHSTSASDSGIDLGELDPLLNNEYDEIEEKRLGEVKDKECAARNAKYNASYAQDDTVTKRSDEKAQVDRDLRKRDEYASLIQMSLKKATSVPANLSEVTDNNSSARKKSLKQIQDQSLKKQSTMTPLQVINEREAEHDKEMTEPVSGNETRGSEFQEIETPLRNSEVTSAVNTEGRETKTSEFQANAQINFVQNRTKEKSEIVTTTKKPAELESGSFIKSTTKRKVGLKKYQYVPIAFMIQTELEHHDIFKEIMMSLFEHIRRPQKLTNDPDADQKLAFADFMAHIAFLATIPSPSFNTLFKVAFFGKTLMIEEKSFDQIPNKNEIAIRVLFDVLDVRTILFCWKALIFDKSLVLLSTQYSLQFYIVSALQQLIFPLVWSNKMIQPANKSNLRFINSIQPIILCVHPNIEDFEHFESYKGGFNELAVCDIDGSFTNDLQFPKLEDENLHLRAIIALKNHKVTRLDSAFSDKYKEDLAKSEKNFVKNVRQIFLNLLNTFLSPVDQYIQRPKDKQMDQTLQFVEYFDLKGYLSEFTGTNLKFAEQLAQSAQFVHFCDDYTLDDLCNFRMYQKICKNSSTLLSLDLQSQTQFNNKMSKIEEQVKLQCQGVGSSYDRWKKSIEQDSGFKIRDQSQIKSWPTEEKITVSWRMPQDNQRVMLYEMLDYHAQVIQKIEMYKFQFEKALSMQYMRIDKDKKQIDEAMDEFRKKEAAIQETYKNFVKTMVDIKEHYPKLLEEYAKQIDTAQKETCHLDDSMTLRSQSEEQSQISSVSIQEDLTRIKTFKNTTEISKSYSFENTKYMGQRDPSLTLKGSKKKHEFFQIDEMKNEDESNRNSFQSETKPIESEIIFNVDDLGLQENAKPQTQIVARQSEVDESTDMDLAVFGQNENFNNLCTLKTSQLEQSEGDQTLSFIEPAQSQAHTRQNTVSIPTKKEANKFTASFDLQQLGNQVRQKLELAKQDPDFQKKEHLSFNELVSNEIKDEKEALAQDKNRIVEFVYGKNGLLSFLDTLFLFFKNKNCLKDIFNYYFALKNQMAKFESYIQESIELVKKEEKQAEQQEKQKEDEQKMSSGLNFNSPQKKLVKNQVNKSMTELRVSKVFQAFDNNASVQPTKNSIKEKIRSSMASRFTVSRESTNMAMGGHKPVQVEKTGLKEFDGVSKSIWLLPVIPEEVLDEDSGNPLTELEKLLAYRYSCQFISMKTKILFHFEDFEEAIARIFDEFMSFPERDQDLFPIEFFKELLRFMSRPQKDRVFLAIKEGCTNLCSCSSSCFQLRLMHYYEMKEKDDIDMELSLKHNVFQGLSITETIEKREKAEAERQRKEKEALIRAQQPQKTDRVSIVSSKGTQKMPPNCFAAKPTSKGLSKDKKNDEQQNALRAKNQIQEAKKRQSSGWSFLGTSKKVKKQNPQSGSLKTNPEKLISVTPSAAQQPTRATIDLSSDLKNSFFESPSMKKEQRPPQTAKHSMIESRVSNQNQTFTELDQEFEELKKELDPDHERANSSIKLNMQKLYGISSCDNNERLSILPDPNKKALKLLKSIVLLIEEAFATFTQGSVAQKRWKIKNDAKPALQKKLLSIKKKELKLGQRDIQIKACSNSPEHIEDANKIKQCFWLNIYNYVILFRIAEISFCQSPEKNLLQEIQQHSMWNYFGLSAKITIMGQTLNAREIRHTILGVKQPAHFRAAFHEPLQHKSEFSAKIQDLIVDKPEPFLFFGMFMPFPKLAHLRLFIKAKFKEQLQEACREQTLHLIQVDPSKFLVRISKAFLYSGNFRISGEKAEAYIVLLQSLIQEKIITQDSDLYANVNRVIEQVKAEIKANNGQTSHLFVMPRIAWQFSFFELHKSIQKTKLQVGELNQNPELFR